jgi:hypothetical protein
VTVASIVRRMGGSTDRRPAECMPGAMTGFNWSTTAVRANTFVWQMLI